MKLPLAFALSLALALPLSGCPHNTGDSIVKTGDGSRLSAEAIDADPLALLPANPVAVVTVDAKAFFESPFGTQIAQLAAQSFPIGQEAGFVPQRDVKKVVGGLYSMAGADGVAVVTGDFHPDLIAQAANRHAMTPLGVPLVHSTYAGNDLFTAGNVGFTVLTQRTMLVGNETGMRRAMDRIRDNRIKREVPDWILKLMDNPQASLMAAGDLTGQPQVAAMAGSLPFLNGVKNFRLLGNFQPPGLNVAGSMTYPDPASAGNAANSLRSLGQMAGLMNLLSAFGFGSPLQNLQAQTVDNDVQFVVAMDGQSVTALLAQANNWRPRM